MDSYKSPARKLITFFKKSRDGWKAKYKEVKRALRAKDGQVRAVKRSRDKWKVRAKETQREFEALKREFEALKKGHLLPPPRPVS